jgi:hypothetical protein
VMLLEVVLAVFVVVITGTASIMAWSVSTAAERDAQNMMTAIDCADDTAERLVSGLPLVTEYRLGTTVCTVEVTYHQGPNRQQTHIVATCDKAVQELWMADVGK